mmetsp:Transcript_28008/g.66833  ORF Transcript_28008/g.66833 Transcript_28008/m.66833 type:complete len:461 (-) Transcript_28008:1188-2570(-)
MLMSLRSSSLKTPCFRSSCCIDLNGTPISMRLVPCFENGEMNGAADTPCTGAGAADIESRSKLISGMDFDPAWRVASTASCLIGVDFVAVGTALAHGEEREGFLFADPTASPPSGGLSTGPSSAILTTLPSRLGMRAAAPKKESLAPSLDFSSLSSGAFALIWRRAREALTRNRNFSYRSFAESRTKTSSSSSERVATMSRRSRIRRSLHSAATAVNWRLSSGGSRQFSPKKFPENSETTQSLLWKASRPACVYSLYVVLYRCTCPERTKTIEREGSPVFAIRSPGAACSGRSFRYSWLRERMSRPRNMVTSSRIARYVLLATSTPSSSGTSSMMDRRMSAIGCTYWWFRSRMTRFCSATGTLHASRNEWSTSSFSLSSPPRPFSASASVAMFPTMNPKVVAPMICATMHITTSSSVVGCRSPYPTVDMVDMTQYIVIMYWENMRESQTCLGPSPSIMNE